MDNCRSESGEAAAGGRHSSKKIALVCDWFLPRIGGIELHLRDLATELRAGGNEVHVITSVPGERVVDGIPVHRLRAPRLPRAGVVFTPAALREIREILAREHYDVVHAHVSIVSPVAFAGAHSALKLKIPTVCTFHSVSPALLPLFGALESAIQFSRWPATFTAVSSMVAEQVRRVTAGHVIHVVPNGIHVQRWRPQEAKAARKLQRDRSVSASTSQSTRAVLDSPDLRAERLTIASIMRLNAKKRPHTLLKMMESLLRQLPPGSAPLLRIAGDGPERPRLERALRRMSLTDHVELLGWQSPESLRDMLADANIFVLPSPLESFGIAALEARCAGLPVVAMSDSGVRDVIAHGREGLLARSEDELVDHVLSLCANPALRERIARHNLATEPAAGWPCVAARVIELYGS